ncbi:MAG TPA: Holliday junction branch migration protein RuvA [Steroidobacteraceae bacterium]|nr:Holliday junction branch migration protein RuvA [Steroidobacteraceae bacterium]
MIGHLRGRLVRKAPPALIVDVNGVGYELEAPMSTFYRLPEVGSEVELATHLVVREDAHLLYGFATEDERRLFRDLLRVTGIGPKIGLALLSGIDVDTFMRCVEAQDAAALTRIPGVGRKTAERLLVEMRDRISALGQMPASTPKGGVAGGARAEAYAALVALGYRPVEVNRLLQGVEQEGAGTEELIRRALQAAAR